MKDKEGEERRMITIPINCNLARKILMRRVKKKEELREQTIMTWSENER